MRGQSGPAGIMLFLVTSGSARSLWGAVPGGDAARAPVPRPLEFASCLTEAEPEPEPEALCLASAWALVSAVLGWRTPPLSSVPVPCL